MNKTSLEISVLVIVAAAIGFYAFVTSQDAAAQTVANNQCNKANCQQNAQSVSVNAGIISNSNVGNQVASNTATKSFNDNNEN
jgi:hypothetical protein